MCIKLPLLVLSWQHKSSLPLSANTEDDGPEGTVTGPVVTTIMDMFNKASTLEKGSPCPEQMEEFGTTILPEQS